MLKENKKIQHGPWIALEIEGKRPANPPNRKSAVTHSLQKHI